jgi:hypothetical protein
MVHSFTLSYTLGNMRCDSRAVLLACTLANPCFGREPKVKVATKIVTLNVECLMISLSPLHEIGNLKPKIQKS